MHCLTHPQELVTGWGTQGGLCSQFIREETVIKTGDVIKGHGPP